VSKLNSFPQSACRSYRQNWVSAPAHTGRTATYGMRQTEPAGDCLRTTIGANKVARGHTPEAPLHVPFSRNFQPALTHAMPPEKRA
jgi:hypothetical protein